MVFDVINNNTELARNIRTNLASYIEKYSIELGMMQEWERGSIRIPIRPKDDITMIGAIIIGKSKGGKDRYPVHLWDRFIHRTDRGTELILRIGSHKGTWKNLNWNYYLDVELGMGDLRKALENIEYRWCRSTKDWV